MLVEKQKAERRQGYCAMCVSRCGSIGVIEDGRLAALEPDPSHPTGKALCAKGRAAPELIYHPDRLRVPMRNVGSRNSPRWRELSWDDALATNVARLGENRAAGEAHDESARRGPGAPVQEDLAAWSVPPSGRRVL